MRQIWPPLRYSQQLFDTSHRPAQTAQNPDGSQFGWKGLGACPTAKRLVLAVDVDSKNRRADVGSGLKVQGNEVRRQVYGMGGCCAGVNFSRHGGLQIAPPTCDARPMNFDLWSPIVFVRLTLASESESLLKPL